MRRTPARRADDGWSSKQRGNSIPPPLNRRALLGPCLQTVAPLRRTTRPAVPGLYRAVQIQATGAEETPATGAAVGRCSFPPKSPTLREHANLWGLVRPRLHPGSRGEGAGAEGEHENPRQWILAEGRSQVCAEGLDQISFCTEISPPEVCMLSARAVQDAGICQVSRHPVHAAQFLRRSGAIRCLSLAEATTVHVRTLR